MVNHSFRTKPKSTKRRSPYWIAKRWMPIGSGLIPSILTTVHRLLFTVLWPRRESSRARPRPSLAFRRGALLLPSGWPRWESSRARPRPSLAFRRCALFFLSSGLIPSILTTDYCPLTTVHWLLFTVLWPRRESSWARPRPSLAFRRCALLLPSGWPRRESNPDLAFRKRLLLYLRLFVFFWLQKPV